MWRAVLVILLVIGALYGLAIYAVVVAHTPAIVVQVRFPGGAAAYAGLTGGRAHGADVCACGVAESTPLLIENHVGVVSTLTSGAVLDADAPAVVFNRRARRAPTCVPAAGALGGDASVAVRSARRTLIGAVVLVTFYPELGARVLHVYRAFVSGYTFALVVDGGL